ncbi:MAG: aldo/keto reductase [Acidobacteriota bacterium]
MNKINRRRFLSSLPAGLLGIGMGNNLSGKEFFSSHNQDTNPDKIQKYNLLGKTGLKVSDVSCGAISLFEPNVLRYAYEMGVNYFDTAESYLRTQSESFIGQALKDVRDKVIITTKYGFPGQTELIKKERIIERVEASLERLQTDYIDIVMVHGINDLEILDNQEIQEAFSRLRKEGKIRFTGFSTHNAALTLNQALNSDFSQVVLFIYNHFEGEEVEPLIKKARQKGIGTVAMKIFAGGKHGNLKSMVSKELSYPQAAIRWVLSNKDIDCCIPTMSSYSHVDEYVAASGKPLNRESANLITSYREQTTRDYCRVSCSQCLDSCPNNVAVNDVLRYAMYFEDYGMEKEAIRYYAELDSKKKAISCQNCIGNCEVACPYNLNIRAKLLKSHRMLSV